MRPRVTHFAHDNRRRGTSDLAFTEPLEVTVDRIEGDEEDREREIDQEGENRIHKGQDDGHEGDRGTDRDPLPDLPDQGWIEPAHDQPMVPGQVPPDDVTQDGQQSDHSAVEGEGNRIRRIRAEDGRDERDQATPMKNRTLSHTRVRFTRTTK